MKKLAQSHVSFQVAQTACRNERGSLVMFPSRNEADMVRNLLTLDIILNLNDERAAAPLYYWIGLKFSSYSNSSKLVHEKQRAENISQ